jgi:hypothetical protein
MLASLLILHPVGQITVGVAQPIIAKSPAEQAASTTPAYADDRRNMLMREAARPEYASCGTRCETEAAMRGAMPVNVLAGSIVAVTYKLAARQRRSVAGDSAQSYNVSHSTISRLPA